jgi:hypothetical protein
VFNTVGGGFDRFTRWMSETSTFSSGDRPTVVHTGFYDERGNFVWRPVLAADGQIEWATAIAEDLAIGSYEGILLESLERWRVTSEMFPSYVRQGYKGLSDVVRSAIEQNRALARQRADTAESSGQAVIAVAGSTNIVGLIVTALYMLIDGEKLWNGFLGLLPEQHRDKFARIFRQSFLGFINGQLLLMLFLTLGTAIVFPLVGVKYALLLAVIVGVLDAIPGIGATLGILLVTALVYASGCQMILEHSFKLSGRKSSVSPC